MSNLQNVIDQIIEEIDFTDDTIETVVEKAFLAGGAAMTALIAIDSSNNPEQPLDDYVNGIAGLTKTVGSFLKSLTPEQLSSYKSNLKTIITNPSPVVELALESFADANIDLTAAIFDMNTAIDNLSGV